MQEVIRAYQVGTRTDSGELEHLVLTYLIDPEGEIAQRYTGLEHTPGEILADLQRVLATP